MSGAVHRTGRTRLTDDELMLCDALFDVWVDPSSLRRQHFREFTNLPYEHGLDDTALGQTLSRLRAAGLVRRRRTRAAATGRVLIWLGLTAKGGALWTRERRPVWARYCTDASWPTRGTDRWVLSVQSPALGTARAFLATATDCGLYDADPRDATVRRRERRPLIPWRVFATVYELRVPLRTSLGGADYDPVKYNRRRVWWRSIAELARWAVA